MIAACPECRTQYRVDPQRLSEEGVRLRCTRCQTVFRVRAPQAQAGAAAGGFEAAPTPTPAPPTASPDAPAPPPADGELNPNLVLIATPDAENAKHWVDTLRGWGLEAESAHDGVEAILKVHRLWPTAIVLDPQLPKMFGFQVCEVIKRNATLRRIGVVLIGAIHHPERYRRSPSELYGADSYVEEPDMPDALAPILRDLGLPIGPGQPAPAAAPAGLASPEPASSTPPVPEPSIPAPPTAEASFDASLPPVPEPLVESPTLPPPVPPDATLPPTPVAALSPEPTPAAPPPVPLGEVTLPPADPPPPVASTAVDASVPQTLEPMIEEAPVQPPAALEPPAPLASAPPEVMPAAETPPSPIAEAAPAAPAPPEPEPLAALTPAPALGSPEFDVVDPETVSPTTPVEPVESAPPSAVEAAPASLETPVSPVAEPAAAPEPVAAAAPELATPAEPEASAAVDPEVEQAERLARIIISDVVLYNEDKFRAACEAGNVLEALEGDLADGRAHFASRIPEHVRNARDFLADELMRLARARGMA